MAIPRSWRVSNAFDGRGLLVYFDPFLEDVAIRQLTGPERASRLDRSGSVSALVEVEEDLEYDGAHIQLNLLADPGERP